MRPCRRSPARTHLHFIHSSVCSFVRSLYGCIAIDRVHTSHSSSSSLTSTHVSPVTRLVSRMVLCSLLRELVRCSSDDFDPWHDEKIDLLVRFSQHILNLFKIGSLCFRCLSSKLPGCVECGSGAALQQRAQRPQIIVPFGTTSCFLRQQQPLLRQ